MNSLIYSSSLVPCGINSNNKRLREEESSNQLDTSQVVQPSDIKKFKTGESSLLEQWINLNNRLKNFDPQNIEDNESLSIACHELREICEQYKGEIKDFDCVLEPHSLPKLPALFMHLIDLEDHDSEFKKKFLEGKVKLVFSNPLPDELLLPFYQNFLTIDLSALFENDPYADCQIACKGRVFNLRSSITHNVIPGLYQDHTLTLDQVDPDGLKIFLKAVYHKKLLLNELSLNQFFSYINTGVMVNQSFALDVHPFLLNQEVSRELLEGISSSFYLCMKLNCNTMAGYLIRAMNEIVGQYFVKGMRNFLQIDTQLLKTFGNYLKIIPASIKPKLTEEVIKFFPNLNQLTLKIGRHDPTSWEPFVERLKHLSYLKFESPCETFDVSELEESEKIKGLHFVIENETKILPISNPQNLKQLENLIYDTQKLKKPRSVSRAVLESIAQLPALKFVNLAKMQDLDCALLEKIMSLPTLQAIDLRECSFRLKGTDSGSFTREFFPSVHHLHTLKRLFPSIRILYDECQGPEALENILATDLSDIIEVQSIENEEEELTPEIADTLLDDCDLSAVFSLYDPTSYASFDRFRDVIPYAQDPITEKLNFYFNASEINGLDSRYRYATQGPIEKTIGDFWSAALTLNTGLIVMLTPLIEKGNTKCAQYWPQQIEDEKTFIDQNKRQVKVKLLTVDETPDVIRRTFLVRDESGKEKEITQLHTPEWPDQTGLSENKLFGIINALMEFEDNAENEATCLHCSAGIGRTGLVTLCLAIEKNLRRLASTKSQEEMRHLKLNPKKALIALRKHRSGMINTPEQLVAAMKYFHFRLNSFLT